MLHVAVSPVRGNVAKWQGYSDPREMIFSDEDGVEVFAVEGEKEVLVSEVIHSQNKEVRPNDPCWCGGGKKYKKYHGSVEWKCWVKMLNKC